MVVAPPMLLDRWKYQKVYLRQIRITAFLNKQRTSAKPFDNRGKTGVFGQYPQKIRSRPQWQLGKLVLIRFHFLAAHSLKRGKTNQIFKKATHKFKHSQKNNL